MERLYLVFANRKLIGIYERSGEAMKEYEKLITSGVKSVIEVIDRYKKEEIGADKN